MSQYKKLEKKVKKKSLLDDYNKWCDEKRYKKNRAWMVPPKFANCRCGE